MLLDVEEAIVPAGGTDLMSKFRTRSKITIERCQVDDGHLIWSCVTRRLGGYLAIHWSLGGDELEFSERLGLRLDGGGGDCGGHDELTKDQDENEVQVDVRVEKRAKVFKPSLVG